MHRLAVDGVERTYYLYVPDQLPPGAPLVIMLHGYGSDGRTVVRDFGWEAEADLGRFVVAAPDASGPFPAPRRTAANRRSWNAGVRRRGGRRRAQRRCGLHRCPDKTTSRGMPGSTAEGLCRGFSSGGQNGPVASARKSPNGWRLFSMSASQVVLFPRPPSRGVPILFSAGDRDPVTPVEGLGWNWPAGGFFVRQAQRTLVDLWRMLDGCPAAQRVPGLRIRSSKFLRPAVTAAKVRYILMQGVAHEWPTSHPINLTRISWEFFKRFSLPPQTEGN